MIQPPATSPCRSCPYRRDVPSGVWNADEYAKLPLYDLPAADQPFGVFMCHLDTGCVCGGWAGCHDGAELISLRVAAASGRMSVEVMRACVDYVSRVPLFASGAEAAEHGVKNIDCPSPEAIRQIDRISRARGFGGTA